MQISVFLVRFKDLTAFAVPRDHRVEYEKNSAMINIRLVRLSP